MSKRLVKIAKELNVGTSTIVDFLTAKGFDIDNKPTAKVDDQMQAVLQEEFSKSASVKKEADALVIGNRPSGQPEETAIPAPPKPNIPPPPSIPAPPPPPPAAKVEPPTTTPEPTPTPEPEVKEESVAEEVVETPALKEAPKVPGLKVLGKVDLDKKPSAPKPKKEEAPKEEPKKEEEPVAEAPKPEAVVEKAPEPAKEPEPAAEAKTDTEAESGGESTAKAATTTKKGGPDIQADAPELRGLKILGKIDIKKPEKKTSSSGSKDGQKDDNKRRRRKRKKITTGPNTSRSGQRSGGGRNRSNNKDEPREVSKKEIEDKIKATMARLQGRGGGKKKRQRLRRENRERLREKQEEREMSMISDKLQVTEFITAQELANMMDVNVSEVVMTAMNAGVIVSINQRMDAEVIELVAEELGHEIEFVSAEESLELEEEEDWVDDPEDLKPRSPIVTVMGHVDHGKTSLLDYIRNANVIAGEAGGITQHIGAYEVTLDTGREITFLDTPGHEAFTAMRARGAKVTDIAIIIIAADDSIMPQTKEAISHAEAAGVPIVFAINKVDKPGANPDKIKTELASMNYQVEEWGGKYQSQDISALKGDGIDDLLEKVLLEADLLELQANPERPAVATVLEASMERGRGYVAKVLVQTGTLNVGDILVAGEHNGRVRAMFNERNKQVKDAGPSTPVLLLGLNGAPPAGEVLKEMDTEQDAKALAGKRAQLNREQANRANKRLSLDEIGRRLALGTFKELNLIVKGDVDGSIEALSDSLIGLSQQTVQVNVIHKAVGQIIESDILLATASDAIIVGFQVRPSATARKLAEREGVQIKTYSIIYEAIEEIKSAIEGMLEPTKEERTIGQLTVQETFKISKVGTIAGCRVDEGKFSRDTKVRVVRDGIVIYPQKEGVVGELSSLKRFKDDVKEVRAGQECGVGVKNYNDIKVGDVIEGYEIIEIKQKMEL
ncbi:MAG: translation initiation factor IF-2 [Bacteroidota bacterium]